MPPRFQLKTRTGPRDLERLPTDDDALGERLFGVLSATLERGRPRPALLVLRPGQVDQVDMSTVLRHPRPEAWRLVAAFAGQQDVECVALVGALRVRARGVPKPAPALVLYVEWPDNRWWTAWRFFDRERALLGEEPLVRRAVDGWPRPSGMGGWFSLARRTGVKLKVERPPDQVVH